MMLAKLSVTQAKLCDTELVLNALYSPDLTLNDFFLLARRMFGLIRDKV